MGGSADLIGMRYDKLLVLSKVEVTPSGARWLCVCDCGKVIVKYTSQLRRLNEASRTGCRSCERQSRSDAAEGHGLCKYGKSKIYQIWKSMRGRCSNPTDQGWKYYGGKGVRVCDEWQDPVVFCAWAMEHGYSEGLTIDRVNSNGNYDPGNCEFVTRSENTKRMHRSKK